MRRSRNRWIRAMTRVTIRAMIRAMTRASLREVRAVLLGTLRWSLRGALRGRIVTRIQQAARPKTHHQKIVPHHRLTTAVRPAAAADKMAPSLSVGTSDKQGTSFGITRR